MKVFAKASALFLVTLVLASYPVRVAHAADCGLLVGIFWGCDVATQDQQVAEEETLQVQAQSAADIEIARLEKEASNAQNRADLLARQYEADKSLKAQEIVANAQRDADQAYAKADERRAFYAKEAQISVADSNNEAKVEVAAIEAESKLQLALVPIGIIVVVILGVYLMYTRYTETQLKLAQVRVLPAPPKPALTDSQAAWGIQADKRGVRWRVQDGEFQVLRGGEWCIIKLPDELPVKQ